MRSGARDRRRVLPSMEVHVQIRWLLASLTLIAFGAPSKSDASSLAAATVIHASSKVATKVHAGFPSRLPDRSDLQYYPLRNYRQYPAAVRRIIRMADIGEGYCRSLNEHYPNRFRACNRGWRIMRRLERLGWCWGYEHRDRIYANEHWLRCSNDPTYRPNYLGNRPPFSEREIRRITNEAGP